MTQAHRLLDDRHPTVESEHANGRFNIDPATSAPHRWSHNVRAEEAEGVLRRAIEDRPGHEGGRIAIGPRREWDAARVERVLSHYQEETDEEAVPEDEAAYESTTHTVMEVPVELVPAVRALIAKQRAS